MYIDVVDLMASTSSLERISSRSEGKACEISDLMDASARLRSVPKMYRTNLGNTLYTSRSQMRMVLFSRDVVFSSSSNIIPPL